MPNRDRKKAHGSSLPRHRTYVSRIRRFDELNSYRDARLGSPISRRGLSASGMPKYAFQLDATLALGELFEICEGSRKTKVQLFCE